MMEVTRDNIEELAEKLKVFLSKGPYTSAAKAGEYTERVRENQIFKDMSEVFENEDTGYRHFNWSDSYGVWGVGVAKDSFVEVDKDRAVVTQTSGAGFKCVWTYSRSD